MQLKHGCYLSYFSTSLIGITQKNLCHFCISVSLYLCISVSLYLCISISLYLFTSPSLYLCHQILNLYLFNIFVPFTATTNISILNYTVDLTLYVGRKLWNGLFCVWKELFILSKNKLPQTRCYLDLAIVYERYLHTYFKLII